MTIRSPHFTFPSIFLLMVMLLPACGWRDASHLREIDRELAEMRSTLSNSSKITQDESVDLEKRVADLNIRLIRLLDTHKNKADIEWRLGESYRLAHQMGLPEAWTESERHLQLAIAHDDENIRARCILGELYLQSGTDFTAKAEKQFRTALESAGTNPLPEAHKGLFYAYFYQGQFEQAVKQAEAYERWVPSDGDFQKVKALALTNLQIQRKKQ